MRIKKNDLVKVRVGDKDQRGVQARVKTVDREKSTVIVEGVNQVKKHLKPSRANARGGRITKEMPIPMANVQVVCPKCGKPTRVGARFLEDGKKVRYCKKCDAVID